MVFKEVSEWTPPLLSLFFSHHAARLLLRSVGLTINLAMFCPNFAIFEVIAYQNNFPADFT